MSVASMSSAMVPPGYGVCDPLMRWSARPKIIRPAGVCSTLVTTIETSCPISARPCSITTIVPSSKYPTPWPIWSPAFTTFTGIASPGRATVFSAFASSFRLMTSTPCNWAILFRLKSFVTTRPPMAFVKSTSRSSTFAFSPGFSSPTLSCTINSIFALFCSRFKMSSPRRPRFRFILSPLSAMACNSFRTNLGTTNFVSTMPVSHTSAIRPSMITLVSRTSARPPFTCLENST